MPGWALVWVLWLWRNVKKPLKAIPKRLIFLNMQICWNPGFQAPPNSTWFLNLDDRSLQNMHFQFQKSKRSKIGAIESLLLLTSAPTRYFSTLWFVFQSEKCIFYSVFAWSVSSRCLVPSNVNSRPMWKSKRGWIHWTRHWRATLFPRWLSCQGTGTSKNSRWRPFNNAWYWWIHIFPLF